MDGNLLSRARVRIGDDAAEPDDLLEFRHQIERDLVAKMNATLEPLLGADRFRAGASVDCDFTSGEQSEETYDPNKSVMVTSQTTEDITTPGATPGGGIPGTASNLPNPAPRTAGRAGNSVSRKTENITYQSSRVVKHTRMPQGLIKKISLSVLLDQPGRWEGQGAARHRVLTPPTPETLQAIKSLVTAATGFNTERGDQITIESLPFETPAEPVTTPAPAPRTAPPATLPQQFARPLLIGGIVLGLALLALCARLLRGGKRRRTAAVEQTLALPAAQTGAEAAGVEGQPATGTLEAALEQETGPRAEELLKAAREAFQRDPLGSATVLRRWIQEGQPS
jgi:flagellar M-ring protein FliF